MRLIYDYSSFRDFLKDYYRSQKEKTPSFSYGVFAKQVGLSSPAHIQLILSGKRNLTVHNIHRVATALALPRPELEYLEALVHWNQASDLVEKRFYKERLERLHQGKPASSARKKVSLLLSSGLLPALLLSIEGKSPDGALPAGDRFGYTHEETAALLKQLLNEGVVELKDGLIRLSQRHLILHDRKSRSQAQKNFLSQQLKLSARAFDRMYEKEGKFYSHTFSVPRLDADYLARFTDEIKLLMEKFTRFSDEEAGDEVLQLNVQLFPYQRALAQKAPGTN